MNVNEMPVPMESAETSMVVRWALYHEPIWPELAMLYHIPNEGKRSVRTGAQMKREGMKSGVPDLHLAWPMGKFHGLYIEMKRRAGETPTQNQADWLENLHNAGYCVCWCRGADEAVQALVNYLKKGEIEYSPTKGRAGQFHAKEAQGTWA